MKSNIKFINMKSYLYILFISLVFISCSTENITELQNDTIESSNNERVPFDSDGCQPFEMRVLYVIYDTTTTEWQNNPEQVKIDFRAEHSNHFTIYSVIPNTDNGCEHTEIWFVDCIEYENYKDQKSNGSTNEEDSKKGKIKEGIPIEFVNCF